MKQYLPKKPVKRGFKVWVRAESATGYFSDFEVYTGKTPDREGDIDRGLAKRVVLKLSQNIEDKNYQLFFDNFFTSCQLVETLLQKKIYSCGTARPYRRGFPQELKGLRLSLEVSFSFARRETS